MQLSNVVNDISQNIDYGNGTLKLSISGDDSNKNHEKSFKDVLSIIDEGGYETDVSSEDEVSDICFDLSNEIDQTEDSLKQDMSLVDILYTNLNIDHQKAENETEYNHSGNISNDITNNNYEAFSDNNNIEKNLQNFQEIFGNNDNKRNVLKNKAISSNDDFGNNDQKFQYDSENFLTGINLSELDKKESFTDIVNIEKQVPLDIKIKNDFNDKFKQDVDKKYNKEENIDKSNSVLNNFDQVNDSSKENFEKDDKKIFSLESNTNKESAGNIVDIDLLKIEENIKFSDNTESILSNKNIESKVINDTKNALVECIRSKDGEFNLYLEPKSLGTLKIKVSFKENNAISVIFNATNSQAIDILKQETSDIINMISSLGFDVNSESLNFNFSQNHSNSNFFKNQSFRSDGDKSVGYSENVGMYKKIWILNDQNIDVLV